MILKANGIKLGPQHAPPAGGSSGQSGGSGGGNGGCC